MKHLVHYLVLIVLLLPAIGNAVQKRKAVPSLPPKITEAVSSEEKSFNRLDPHGSHSIKVTAQQAQENNECLVCHLVKDHQLLTKPNAADTCFNCHNHSPHSGVVEHLNHKITCADCHASHRSDAIRWTSSSDIFKNLISKKLEADVIQKKSNSSENSAMLKKNCSDCHKW